MSRIREINLRFFFLPEIGLVCGEQKNLRDKESVVKAIRTSVMSKQYGNEDFLAELITDACSKYPSFYTIKRSKVSTSENDWNRYIWPTLQRFWIKTIYNVWGSFWEKLPSFLFLYFSLSFSSSLFLETFSIMDLRGYFEFALLQLLTVYTNLCITYSFMDSWNDWC